MSAFPGALGVSRDKINNEALHDMRGLEGARGVSYHHSHDDTKLPPFELQGVQHRSSPNAKDAAQGLPKAALRDTLPLLWEN